jgi:hypothetical protein
LAARREAGFFTTGLAFMSDIMTDIRLRSNF